MTGDGRSPAVTSLMSQDPQAVSCLNTSAKNKPLTEWCAGSQGSAGVELMDGPIN